MTSPDSRPGRQFEIDRLCTEYADAVEAGRNPDPAAFLAGHPDYQQELADYIIMYHLALADLPAPDETPEPERSPAFARALAAIHTREAAALAAPMAAFASLEDRAFDAGSTPEAVAARVGLTPRLLARLDAHAIAAASIPRALFRRLSEALDISEQAIMSYLGAGAQAGGAFFDADQAPTGAQEDFLAAIAASDLDPQRKAEWRAISDAESGPQ